MINLFHIENHVIETSSLGHFLHGDSVQEFEKSFCEYVGAKYGVALNSATNAIFLSLLKKNVRCRIPTVIPPVVCNAILTSGNDIQFVDDVSWVGDSYILHDFRNYKIIDSAQKVQRSQYMKEASDEDLMIFSFYPTKPIGSCDGGMVVSNDENKIEHIRTLAYNGMSREASNWDRSVIMPGFKFYMNSVQAYIAMKNLNRLDTKNEKLDEIRNFYNEEFDLNNTSNHLYQVNVKDNKFAMDYMTKRGVCCGIHYRCAHKENAYSKCKTEDVPLSLKHEKHSLSIPFHENLSASDLRKICKHLQGVRHEEYV